MCVCIEFFIFLSIAFGVFFFFLLFCFLLILTRFGFTYAYFIVIQSILLSKVQIITRQNVIQKCTEKLQMFAPVRM